MYACNCPGQGRSFATAACSDPDGRCAEVIASTNHCVLHGYTYTCTEYEIEDCPPPFHYCRNPYLVPPETSTDVPCENCCLGSPIIIDVQGNGYNLTSVERGVDFDLDIDGVPEHLAWTSANSDDAFLVLDRNGNGRIDNGGELFGNYSAQPPSENPNGFIALAEFDKQANGGNLDGVISSQDVIFSRLRLWKDVNHNGISEPSELQTLTASQFRALDLDYLESRRSDEHGNEFKYRAKIFDARSGRPGRWAWDVFLVVQN